MIIKAKHRIQAFDGNKMKTVITAASYTVPSGRSGFTM